MFVNQVYDNIKGGPKYPKSLMKLIKFYRLFGFSFSGISSEGNEKKWSKIKRYLLMAYNLVVIFVMISVLIYSTPRIFEEQQKFGVKKVMKGVFLVSRLISWSDVIFGYLLPLIKGKQFLKFLSNEELCAIDCNTRIANNYLISDPKSRSIVSVIFRTFFVTFCYFNGVFVIPVFYYCITFLFISQINELNSGLSKGIIDILSILTL
jgi:hypothetical protein